MKINAISVPSAAAEALQWSQRCGYITFVYHHADPSRTLVKDKFLYVRSDKELLEKIQLLQRDFTAQYSIQQL